jgi:hypothetical protein
VPSPGNLPIVRLTAFPVRTGGLSASWRQTEPSGQILRHAHRVKPSVAQALAAAEKAGGFKRRSGGSARGSTFGRGRAASFAAARSQGDRSRGAVVKARVVRHGLKQAPLGKHLEYLRRDGVTKDGATGGMFDACRRGWQDSFPPTPGR